MDSKNTNLNQGVIRMTTKVQKWGNSLAVRIPSNVAESVAIQQGSEMELSVGVNEIKLVPIKKKMTLEDLVSQITPENRHEEIGFGKAGKELF